MGQKTNANILRLGVTKNWKTEFFEKNKKELPLYIFKDLEIKDYLEKFFNMNGAFIQDYRQHYSNKTLNLYISYFVYKKSNFHLNQSDFLSIKLKTVSGKTKTYSDSSIKQKNNLKYFKHKPVKFANLKKSYLIKNYLKNVKLLSNDFKIFDCHKNFKNMLRVILNFTQNKFNIIITFSCINKDFNYFCFLKNKKVKMLRKFQSTLFFKNGIELMFHVAFNRNSAILLGKFIAFHLQQNDTQVNFFLRFLKQTLLIFLNSNLSLIKGVKIILKGRLKKGPRAKKKILIIGDVPVQSFNEILDYYQTTTHNSKGSFGIKVWIIEK